MIPLAIALASTVAWTATPERLSRLNAAETQLSAEQAHNMTELARLLSAIEQLRRDPPPALLVSADDALGAVRAQILVRALTPELQRRARNYAYEAGQMMRQRRLAAVESEALFASDSASADTEPPPGDEPAGRPAPPAEAAGPLVPPERLLSPVAAPLARRFGQPAPGGGPAEGLTWAAPRTARVTSPAPGVVQYVGPVKGWGVILILRLTGGYHLVLAGLGQAQVAVGQSVAAGQPVGWMPDGRQSAFDLYLELRSQAAPVDPTRWLRKVG